MLLLVASCGLIEIVLSGGFKCCGMCRDIVTNGCILSPYRTGSYLTKAGQKGGAHGELVMDLDMAFERVPLLTSQVIE